MEVDDSSQTADNSVLHLLQRPFIVSDSPPATFIFISERSGIDQVEISKYRSGFKKDMKVSTFFRLVHALPFEARSHFMSLCSFEVDSSEELVA